jgi:hypothetical protein
MDRRLVSVVRPAFTLPGRALSTALHARQKQRHESAQHDARRQAGLNLAPVLNVPFHIRNISRRALEAITAQWDGAGNTHGIGGWDWDEVYRQYKGSMGSFGLTVWSDDDRLSAIAMACSRGDSVSLEFIEGDPRSDCALRGHRLLIVLEAVTCYAQGLGKPRIRLNPANGQLAELYVRDFGFSLEIPRKEAPYYSKEV